MTIISGWLIYGLTTATVSITAFVYLYLLVTYRYWKARGVPFVKPELGFGNLKELLFGRKALCEIYQQVYDAMIDQRYAGFYEIAEPVLMIRDPGLVERILKKDFIHFHDRGFHPDCEHDLLSNMLFNLEGNIWRNLRYKLKPIFSSRNLKLMLQDMLSCGGRFLESIEKESQAHKPIYMKHLLNNLTLEIIAKAAFGLHYDNDVEAGRKFSDMINIMMKPSKMQIFRMYAVMYLPNIRRLLRVKQFSQRVEDFIFKVIGDVINYRRAKGETRNDFLQLMLSIQEEERNSQIRNDLGQCSDEDIVKQDREETSCEETPSKNKQSVAMTDSVIAAQCFFFLTAALDAVSSTINFVLYNLAQNPNIQERVHKELDSVFSQNNNNFSYQTFKEMVYLEQVIQETLRMYPVTPFLNRICTERYAVPDSTLVVEKGTHIIIPIKAIHNDPQYYESPQVFDPERFQGKHFKFSCTYFPFGDGPRTCIGVTFALLQVKNALARLLMQYTVRLAPGTKMPFACSKKTFLLSPEQRFLFEFDKRHIKSS